VVIFGSPILGVGSVGGAFEGSGESACPNSLVVLD